MRGTVDPFIEWQNSSTLSEDVCIGKVLTQNKPDFSISEREKTDSRGLVKEK